MMTIQRFMYIHFLASIFVNVIKCFVKFVDIYDIKFWLYFKAKIKKTCSRKERKYINVHNYLSILWYGNIRLYNGQS